MSVLASRREALKTDEAVKQCAKLGVTADKLAVVKGHGVFLEQRLSNSFYAAFLSEGQCDRTVGSLANVIVIINQTVNIGCADDCEVVIKRHLKRRVVEVLAVCDFDAVDETFVK